MNDESTSFLQALGGLDLELVILRRHLAGDATPNPLAAVQAIDRMTAALMSLREQLPPPWPVAGDGPKPGATHLRLCAHADEDGQGAHWLEPGETCDRERAPDLLSSAEFCQLRACLDEVGALEGGR